MEKMRAISMFSEAEKCISGSLSNVGTHSGFVRSVSYSSEHKPSVVQVTGVRLKHSSADIVFFCQYYIHRIRGFCRTSFTDANASYLCGKGSVRTDNGVSGYRFCEEVTGEAKNGDDDRSVLEKREAPSVSILDLDRNFASAKGLR